MLSLAQGEGDPSSPYTSERATVMVVKPLSRYREPAASVLPGWSAERRVDDVEKLSSAGLEAGAPGRPRRKRNGLNMP